MNRNKRTYELFENLKLEKTPDPATKALKDAEKGMDDPDEILMLGNETILLVDDEKIIIDVARDMLEILGYKVIAAQRGRETIDIYTRLKDEIALVILDMVMPGLNGAEVFLALKEINPNVKVILASGYVVNRQIDAVMQQGCRAFMPKPFSLEELSVKVRQVLDSP
jgi:two-component system, cell cycle sensor histidine kinase and response regulator CckA